MDVSKHLAHVFACQDIDFKKFVEMHVLICWADM